MAGKGQNEEETEARGVRSEKRKVNSEKGRRAGRGKGRDVCKRGGNGGGEARRARGKVRGGGPTAGVPSGKGGGEAGGRVVACGTPEMAAESKESITGKYIAREIGQ